VYSDPSGTDSVDEQAALSAAHQQLAEQEYHRYLAEQYVQHDLETGQTIDPSVGVEGPEAVHPQVAFASEILANIDARLTAERAEALTGEGGASSGLAEMEARHPFAGASGQSAQPNEIGPMTDAELGFWQTLGGAYLGARVPSGPAHAVGGAHPGERRVPRRSELRARHHGRVARHARRLPGSRPRRRRGR
jgi:hypothetical protein